jgi:addiction module RelE/StbE family toxin
MPYKEQFHPKVKSDLKGLDKAAKKDIYNFHIEKILEDPYGSEKLHGNLVGFFSYHFRKNKIDYRVVYAVEEEKKIVYFLMIGKRENFYDFLKRRLS